MVRTITENDFLKQVIDLAHLRGWMVAHFRPSVNRRGKWSTAVQADGQGFPDLVLVSANRERVIFVEIKSAKGRLSESQCDWLSSLQCCDGVEVYMWRPYNFSEIERILI